MKNKQTKIKYMNEFFLNKTNINNILNNCFILDEKKNEHKDEKNRDDKQYMKKEPINDEKMVNENDKLFWFWYIFTHGYEKYEFLGKYK